MSAFGGPPPHEGVPTLTEVVVMPDGPVPPPQFPTQESMPLEAAGVAPVPVERRAVPRSPGASPDQLVQGVLSAVEQQVELMLEYRLREVLTPILARAADNVIREARAELASTLRDVVSRAVAQELARHRSR